jgi:hypothetical protein
MKNILILILVLFCSACVAGEFTPQRHAQHEYGHPDCKTNPEKCINGVAW